MRTPVLVLLLSFSTCVTSLFAQQGLSTSDTLLFKPEDTRSYALTTTTADVFEKAKEKYKNQLLSDTLPAVRIIRDSLLISADNGFIRKFRSDKEDSEDAGLKRYYYKGYYERIPKYLVLAEYWEEEEYLLVDKHTGRLDTLCSEPVFSPKGNYLCTFFVNGIGVEVPYGHLYIYKTGSTLVQLIDLMPNTWLPEEVFWADDRNLIIGVAGDEGEDQTEHVYLRLTVK